MSHRVSTTIDDETWGALDLLRETRGRDTVADMLRAIVEDAVDEFRGEMRAARQMGLTHPALHDQTEHDDTPED